MRPLNINERAETDFFTCEAQLPTIAPGHWRVRVFTFLNRTPVEMSSIASIAEDTFFFNDAEREVLWVENGFANTGSPDLDPR